MSSTFSPRGPKAFTLLEVLIAMTLFFMAIFVILHLISQNLAAARLLQKRPVDLNSLVTELYLTNRVDEGIETGDFGEAFPGYSWTRTISEVFTNGLFQVEVTVYEPGRHQPMESTASFLLFRPDSSALPGNRARR